MVRKNTAKPVPRKSADRPCLISNTVRTRLLSQGLSEAARAAVERAKWLEARQCWVMDVPPWATLRDLEDVCASPSSGT